MSLDLSTIGFITEPISFSYDWKTLALYALGIGAKRDELDYLYEGRGPKVYPTFAVIPSFPVLVECLDKTKCDRSMVVHGSQSVVVARDLPPSGKLITTGTLAGIYDMKKFAQVVVKSESKLETGELVYSTTWGIIVRGAGGFGGAHPPKAEFPSIPKDRPADFRVEEQVPAEQALLYRLSGDLNPLHADPEFAASVGFEQGPILHGLATYGYSARALIKSVLGGDASRLKRFDGQFSRPVWPGDTLVVEGWTLDGGKIAWQTSVAGRPDAVITRAFAEIV